MEILLERFWVDQIFLSSMQPGFLLSDSWSILAASASCSACTIFSCCSCFTFSTKNRAHRTSHRATCLTSMAAGYSWLKLKSVITTSPRMWLKSLVCSESFFGGIKGDTWAYWVITYDAVNLATTLLSTLLTMDSSTHS